MQLAASATVNAGVRADLPLPRSIRGDLSFRTTYDHRAGSERLYLLFLEPALFRDDGSPRPVALR